jgi:NADP-dependent 3-hydroxy acid dehydrogenase YdfG
MMLEDKVIVIVGATGGIGSTLTRQLSSTGARLVLVARDGESLAALANELSGEVLTVPTDITQPQQVDALIQRTIAQFGQIDVLVNAAGAGILKAYNTIESADLDAMLDLNLKGCFYTTQAAAKEMQKRKSGHICNVVGILGKHSMPMAAA